MTKKAEQAVPTINVFEQLNLQKKEDVVAMVNLMMQASDVRVKAFSEMTPDQVGLHYAAYARYVAPEKPYSPNADEMMEIIGLKLSIITQAVDDGMPYEILWALDSGILSDISRDHAMTFKKAVDTAVATAEHEDAQLDLKYDH